jgi:hypothetical protein
MSDSQRPELIRVGGGRRLAPSLMVVVTAVVLVGAAIWKPWQAADRPAASAGPSAAATAGSPAATGSSPGGPAGSAPGGGPPTPGPQPLLFHGLDLAFLGTYDAHTGWGVAVASVPTNEVPTATGAPPLVPVVDWQAVNPRANGPGPTLDPSGSTTLAVAVTWPAGTQPVSVGLDYLGPVTPSGSQRPDGPAGSPRFQWLRGSGAFYVAPTSAVADDPSGWLARGWPAGNYEFFVTQLDGSNAILFFKLSGSTS